MSILRSAALLAARAGCVCAGPGLPSQLGALSALQHKLGGLIQPAGWLQARGFAAPSGGGTGGSGSGGEQQPPRPDAQPQQPAAAAAAASQKSGDEQQAAASAQQAEAPRPEPEQPAEQQAQQGDAAGSQQPPSPEVEQDPRLAKFVEGLKQLKGSSTVQHQTLGGDTPWWLSMLSNWVGPMVQNWIADFVKAKVETQFDADEFLEGAADAFTVVNELLAEGDWDTLRPMMSAKMFNALKSTDEAYRADGLVWRMQLGGPPKVGLRGVGFLFKEQMAQYDEEIAKLGPDNVPAAAAPSGLWIVLTVQFKCEQLTTITRAEDGQVVAELKDLRPQRWKFAAGPLEGPLPVPRLENEWFLLTI